MLFSVVLFTVFFLFSLLARSCLGSMVAAYWPNGPTIQPKLFYNLTPPTVQYYCVFRPGRMSNQGSREHMRREPSTSMLRLGVCCVGVAMIETDMVICCSPRYHVRQRSSLLGGRPRAAPLRCSLKKEKMDSAGIIRTLRPEFH